MSDTEPGIRRSPKGTGFCYHDASGRRISLQATLQRIRALGVPPAWTEVWICPEARGHIQATGRDARGRKQYRYHDDWREVRDQNKFERIVDFARLLPGIRARVAKDLSKRGRRARRCWRRLSVYSTRPSYVSANGEYAKENGTYGLTTLRSAHLDVEGSELRFH